MLYEMNIDVAMQFYQRCIEREAETEEERNDILVEMVNEGLIKNVTVTERSREKYIEDLAKNFNVLKIDKKEENNDSVE